jgi:hypothetical protein
MGQARPARDTRDSGRSGDRQLSLPPRTMPGMSNSTGVVIDAALRFARSNPELLRYAQQNAGANSMSVDELLRQAIDRVIAARSAEPLVTDCSAAGQPLLRAL